MNYSNTNYPFKKSTIYQNPETKFRGRLPYHLPAEIAALFVDGRGSWLLEIGCGTGQNREFFESRGYRYIGVDIRSHGADVVCDADFLPFKSGIFKAAVTFSTLEHLWDPFVAVREVYRVLASNSQFDGEAAFLEALHDNSCCHLSSVGLRACLQNTGFSVERIWPGWGLGESLGHYIFKQFRVSFLGRSLGKAFDGAHQFGLVGKNLVRRILGVPPVPMAESLLRFAGSIHWIAVKRDSGKPRMGEES